MGREQVEVAGKPRHVISYLQDFLFSPQRARSPVRSLSGGERNRLLLAKLFLQPTNLLVLDEPTNDLDVETLELLEELLQEYSGTLLLVSHDRAFLDNVITSCLVFETCGEIGDYVGGYSDWLRQRQQTAKKSDATAVTETTLSKSSSRSVSKKLTYKEQRELASLPQQIESLESEHEELVEKLGDPAFYQGDKTTVSAATKRVEVISEELARCYSRWEELEG